MILAAPAGPRFDELSVVDQIDVAYYALLEPHVNGSWTGVDAVIREWDEILSRAIPDPDAFGLSEVASSGLEAAERQWDQARKITSRPRRGPLRAVVGSGNPMDAGAILAWQRSFAAAMRTSGASTLSAE